MEDQNNKRNNMLLAPKLIDGEETTLVLNELSVPALNDSVMKKRSTLRRTKSQWDNFVESVDVKKSIHSGVFKLTLHQLARDGETAALTDLLKNVPEQQLKRMLNTSLEDHGGTPIHLAARHNHYNVCEVLIRYGANVDSRGEGLATPLHYAAKYKPKKKSTQRTWNQLSNQNVINLLAASGAKVNLTDMEGQTPLHAASIKGNTQAVSQLLQCSDIDIKIKDIQGMTALHMAATHGHVAIFRLLIEQGADLHSCDNDLLTPLHFACSEGNTDIVQMILEKLRQDGGMSTVMKMLVCPDAGRATCLHVSVGKGHKEMLLQLLKWMKKSGSVTEFVNMPTAHNSTALHIAANQGHTEVAEILIDHGAKVEARNDSLATPLLLASQYNYFRIIELLHKHKAEMEIRDKDSMTPLLVAAKNGNLETVSWLIENGADVTATNKDDKSCLMLAVEVKKTRAVQELLTYDSVRSLLSETDKNTNSVLHIAAKNGHVPLIKILVENGARIDFKNEDEATPVHIAAMYGQHAALWELLENNRTMINSLDENANTALHLAATDGHTRCVQILLEFGANVEFRNTRQWSALDCACAKGRDSTVLELLQAHSPLNPPKMSKSTPLHQACLNGHVHIVNLLLEWKADVSAPIMDGRNPLDCAIDKENRGCVEAILLNENWKNAMRNAYLDLFTGYITTPMRKLIVKMPDMAELAFSRSITNDGKPLDDVNLEVTLDYEFLDDMYTVVEWVPTDNDEKRFSEKEGKVGLTPPDGSPWKAVNGKDNVAPLIPESDCSSFDEEESQSHHSLAYSVDSSVLRYNHPLHIMANKKRERLLQHPVVTGLLLYKWNKYGGLVYYSSLAFILLFVSLLNVYIIALPPPYAIDFLKSLANRRYYKEFSRDDLLNYTKPKSCYNTFQSGADYRGFVSKGASGAECVYWNETGLNSNLFPESGLDKNYCRNPETQFRKPWCYTHYNSSNPSSSTRETCDIPSCPVYVKGENIPLGKTCHFPFLIGGKNVSGCLQSKARGRWCSYTYDYDRDRKWGQCSKENTLCDDDPQYRVPCGTPKIDRYNCEARGCCFTPFDDDKSSEQSRGICYKMLDPCRDRSSYCEFNKTAGMCVTKRSLMAVRCARTCEFCNVTKETHHDEEEKHHEFLHLMSNYPPMTFDASWTKGCYYMVDGADKKWGGGCHFKRAWEDPIRFALLILSASNLMLLVFEIWSYKADALRPILLLKIILFSLSLLFTMNFNAFDIAFARQMILEKDIFQPLVNFFQTETGIRQHWQWQCGAFALFLSWMDLLLYIRKIPYLGIYVVMFNDVFRTFVKFSLVFLLFILSFALTFHSLLQNGVQFDDPFKSILKTSVMMIGEVDFRETFYSRYTTYPHVVHYERVTFVIFLLFIFVIMIIIMNLLVGLAVGDIIEVKENATLERLKMQVDLALEVEFSVPYFLRKRFVRKSETFRPNRYRKSNALVKAFLQDQNLSSKNIVNAMSRNKSETEEIYENVSFLNHVIVGLCTKTNDVDAMVRDMMTEVREMKQKMLLTATSPTTTSGESQQIVESLSSIDQNYDAGYCFATCDEVKSAASAIL